MLSEIPQNKEAVKLIEIPAAEMAAAGDAADYWRELLAASEADFNGPLFGSKEAIRGCFRKQEFQEGYLFDLLR